MLVSSLACNPTSLGQNAVSTCTVTLTQTAPTGGSSVTLTNNNASLTVPASVTVAAGATSATFSATAAASIASNQSATVTATLGSSSQRHDQSGGAGAGLLPGLQSDQSGTERCQHVHGDADPDRSDRRIERDAGQQQHFAHRAGVGDGSGSSHRRDVQRHCRATIASNQSAIVTATLGSSSQAAAISLIAGSGGGGGSYSFWAAPANLTLSAPIGGGTVTQTVVLNVQSSFCLTPSLRSHQCGDESAAELAERFAQFRNVDPGSWQYKLALYIHRDCYDHSEFDWYSGGQRV